MATIFTQILEQKVPGHFIWKDEHCFAILTTSPINAGHTMVIPREEVDYWIDLEPALLAHLNLVAQKVAQGIQQAFKPAKVGVMIAGLEVRHVHIHLIPIWDVKDLNFDRHKDATQEELKDSAKRLREALRRFGYSEAAE